MHIAVNVEESLRKEFPDLLALLCKIHGVKVKKSDSSLEKLKDNVTQKVRKCYIIDSLKDMPVFRAYRDFFWKINMDPTKTRPAAEALIRRILGGGSIPCINTLVDAYNVASVETMVSLAAFDEDKIKGNLLMRRAKFGEIFLGVGMEKPKVLRGGEIIVVDDEKLIAIYPYRDAEDTKVTLSTANIQLMTCGVPGISLQLLLNAQKVASDYITKFCGGLLIPFL